jgi:hypothetical protein
LAETASVSFPDVLLDTAALAKRYRWSEQYARLLRAKGGGPPYIKPTLHRTSRCYYRISDVLVWESRRSFNSTAAYTVRADSAAPTPETTKAAPRANAKAARPHADPTAKRGAARCHGTAPAAP